MFRIFRSSPAGGSAEAAGQRRQMTGLRPHSWQQTPHHFWSPIRDHASSQPHPPELKSVCHHQHQPHNSSVFYFKVAYCSLVQVNNADWAGRILPFSTSTGLGKINAHSLSSFAKKGRAFTGSGGLDAPFTHSAGAPASSTKKQACAPGGVQRMSRAVSRV